jgi:hypothetical protein
MEQTWKQRAQSTVNFIPFPDKLTFTICKLRRKRDANKLPRISSQYLMCSKYWTMCKRYQIWRGTENRHSCLDSTHHRFQHSSEASSASRTQKTKIFEELPHVRRTILVHKNHVASTSPPGASKCGRECTEKFSCLLCDSQTFVMLNDASGYQVLVWELVFKFGFRGEYFASLPLG